MPADPLAAVHQLVAYLRTAVHAFGLSVHRTDTRLQPFVVPLPAAARRKSLGLSLAAAGTWSNLGVQLPTAPVSSGDGRHESREAPIRIELDGWAR